MNSILDYNSNDSDDDIGSNKLDLCMVCKLKPKIYKCPGCNILTCSLICCQNHKIEKQCNGKRNRVEYVKNSEYNANNLRNDYHFLEDVLQTKQRGKRLLITTDAKGSIKKKKSNKNYSSYPKHVQNLVEMAGDKDINLILMPNGMTKRMNNTTNYFKPINQIHWKIQLVFILSSNYKINQLFDSKLINNINTNEMNLIDQLVSFTCNNVSENTKIADIIDQLINNNHIHRYTLRYIRKNLKQLRCLLHIHNSPGNNPTFYEINLDSSLLDALSNKSIIEYPTFYIGTISDTNKLNIPIVTLNNDNFDSIVDDIDEDNDDDTDDNEVFDEDKHDQVIDNDFMQALHDFENKDIESIKQFINSVEL